MTEPPEYVTRITAPGVHNEPAKNYQLTQLTEDQLRVAREKTTARIIQIVVQAVTGIYVPIGNETSDAEQQLAQWAADLADVPIIGDLIETLTGVEDGDMNDLGTWVNNFFNNPLGTLFPEVVPQLPPTRIDGVSGSTLLDDLANTWNNFWDGIFGTSGSTNKNPFDVGYAADNINTRVTAGGSATDSLSQSVNAPNISHVWVSAGMQDDVTFPHSNVDGTVAPTLGSLLLLPIAASKDRVYTHLKVGVTNNLMTSFFVGVYQLDKVTGTAVLVSDCGNVKSLIDSAFDLDQFELPEPLSVTKGDVYYVAALQVGGTSAPMSRWSNSTVMTTGTYPEAPASAVTGQSSLPATIAPGARVSANRYWASLGLALELAPPAPKYFRDTFNRIGLFDLGDNWFQRYITPLGTQRLNIRNDAVSTPDVGIQHTEMWVTKPATDDHFVRITMDTGGGFRDALALFVRSSPASQVYGGSFDLDDFNYHIANRIGGYNEVNGGGTTRATGGSPDNVVFTTWELRAVGNVYTFLENDEVQCQWTDSTGISLRGPTQREVGIALTSAGSSGGSIVGQWEAGDL